MLRQSLAGHRRGWRDGEKDTRICRKRFICQQMAYSLWGYKEQEGNEGRETHWQTDCNYDTEVHKQIINYVINYHDF